MDLLFDMFLHYGHSVVWGFVLWPRLSAHVNCPFLSSGLFIITMRQ